MTNHFQTIPINYICAIKINTFESQSVYLRTLRVSSANQSTPEKFPCQRDINRSNCTPNISARLPAHICIYLNRKKKLIHGPPAGYVNIQSKSSYRSSKYVYSRVTQILLCNPIFHLVGDGDGRLGLHGVECVRFQELRRRWISFRFETISHNIYGEEIKCQVIERLNNHFHRLQNVDFSVFWRFKRVKKDV